MVELKKTAVPRNEIGYVTTQGQNTDWQQWDSDERVPELQWPQCNHVYSRMMKEDGRVSSVLSAIGLPIRSAHWWVDPNGSRDEVAEFVSRNLGLPILGTELDTQPRMKGRFSWAQHLQNVLLMLPYGHSIFEQVYSINEDATRAMLHKLAPRPQKTISKINVALDGGLESIRQHPPASTERVMYGIGGVEIPVSRLVAYVRDPEPGDWRGNSILRPAYKHWLLKDEFMRIQAGAARRHGMGVPVGTASKDDDQEEVDHMQAVASNYRGGSNSGVGLAKGQKLDLLAPTGTVFDMQPAINFHDKSIALAGLAHFLNLDRGGSYALASVLADPFVQSVQALGEFIRDTSNAHVVEDLVDINFGEDEPSPRIVFDEIGSRQDATAAALGILVQNGLLEPDDELKIMLRQKFGLTTPDSQSAKGAPEPNEGGAE